MTYTLPPNPLRARLEADETAYGIYVAIAAPAIVELAALAGLDFVRIDWAHGVFDLVGIENMLRAAEVHGIAPIVRLEASEQKITSVLEAGAMGVVVPGIESREAAEAVVAAAKFAPLGARGMFSTARRQGYGAVSASTFREWTNREVLVGVQIESLAAIENLDAIVSVPGIDVVQSGRGDIANALGLPGQKDHQDVLALEARIFRAARAHGLAVSPQLDPGAADFAQTLEAARAQGARIISLGVDLGIIGRALRETNALARRAERKTVGA